VFGPVANEGVASMQDLNPREFLVLGLVAAGVLVIGLWPAPLVEVLSASVDNLASHITQSKL
jgi:NADH-quinone oxidoreductase subunit M